jgi:hypothetical protein
MGAPGNLQTHRLYDLPGVVSEQQCTMTGPVVDILSALKVPLLHTLSPLDVNGIGLQKAAVMGYAVWEEFECPIIPRS